MTLLSILPAEEHVIQALPLTCKCSTRLDPRGRGLGFASGPVVTGYASVAIPACGLHPRDPRDPRDRLGRGFASGPVVTGYASVASPACGSYWSPATPKNSIN